MTKYMRYILPAIALAILFTASAGEASAQDILRQILKRMDDNNKSLVSLKGAIKMAKTDATLGETDTTEGELSYLPASPRRRSICGSTGQSRSSISRSRMANIFCIDRAPTELSPGKSTRQRLIRKPGELWHS
jgi:hypothetical protein